MRETFYEGYILIYGAGEIPEAMECILKGSGYGVMKTKDRSVLPDMADREDVLMILLNFGKRAREAEESLKLFKDFREIIRKPMIVMLGEGNEKFRIPALNAGADDILDVSCSLLESVARIQAQMRCYKRLTEKKEEKRCIRLDELEVDDIARQVSVKGNRVDLTPTEYKILHLLVERPGRVLSNSQIYEQIWKASPLGSDNTVAVHIRHIREKIEENPQEPRYLQVVWGQGYKVCCG